MTVERFDLDHDVPGASGYLVTTSDGVLAFTGDIRFHGHHPERSWADVTRDYGAALAANDLMLQAVRTRWCTGSARRS
jgi:ribonuclease J